MHRDQRAKPAGAGKRREGVRKRTDGSPHLKAPGEPGNPYPEHYAIAWTERRDGRSRSRVITTRETEAARAHDALTLFVAERTRPPEQQNLTIRRICEAYKDGKREEAHSFKSLESALRPAIEHFGALRPDEVTPAYVRDYVAKRRKAPKQRGSRHGIVTVAGRVSDKTIDNELRMLRAACAWVKKHLGWKFDTPEFVLPGGGQPRKRTLSRREAAAVFRELAAPSTPTHLRVFVLLALLTGQRSGAVRALKWEHIDFDDGMIWFSRAKPHAPKNKRVRDMPMTTRMLAVLQDTQAAVLEKCKTDEERAAVAGRHVVEFKGKPVASLKTAWATLLKRAGIEGVRVHDLRRTAATGALNRGASMADVALFLNDSEKITARHYAHAAPALLLDVVRRIEGLGDEPEA